MSFTKTKMLGFVLGVFVAIAPSAHAAMAVIDIRAVTQLVQQIRTMQQQLETARSQLTQAQTQFNSMTGGRAMESLLAGTVRNYLPADWAQLQQNLRGTIGAYGALAAELERAVDSNAVLSAAEVAALSPLQQEQLREARRSAAMLQVTARQALTTTSQRFASIQQLINAIPRATDQKAILDLQARIAAEQGMLQNEQTKLDILERTAQAEDLARRQRIREQAIADIGSLRRLPAMGL